MLPSLAPPQWWRKWDLTHYAAWKAADHAQTHCFCDQIISRSHGWNMWLNAPHLPRSKRHLISGIAITPYLFRNSDNMTTITPPPLCFNPISHKSSVISVMSFFSRILTLFVIIKFPTSHIIRGIRDVNAEFHPNSFPLLSNFPSPQCIAGKFPISHSCRWYSCSVAVVHDIRDINDSVAPCLSPLLFKFRFHTPSVTSVMSIFSWILTLLC